MGEKENQSPLISTPVSYKRRGEPVPLVTPYLVRVGGCMSGLTGLTCFIRKVRAENLANNGSGK